MYAQTGKRYLNSITKINSLNNRNKDINRAYKNSYSVIQKQMSDEEITNSVKQYLNDKKPVMQNFAVVFHEPSEEEPWNYTRTVYCDVRVDGVIWSVRGHIHYENDKAGPGNMWTSGVKKFSFKTPCYVVEQFNDITLDEKVKAVNEYNTRHNTNYVAN